MMIPRSVIIEAARSLASEHGENREYDRALVELVMRVTACTEDDRAEVEKLILPDRWAVERKYGIGYFGPLWKKD